MARRASGFDRDIGILRQGEQRRQIRERRVVLRRANHAKMIDNELQSGMPLGDLAEQWKEPQRVALMLFKIF